MNTNVIGGWVGWWGLMGGGERTTPNPSESSLTKLVLQSLRSTEQLFYPFILLSTFVSLLKYLLFIVEIN